MDLLNAMATADRMPLLSFDPTTRMVKVSVLAENGIREKTVSYIDPEAVKANDKGEIEQYLLNRALPYYSYTANFTNDKSVVDMDSAKGIGKKELRKDLSKKPFSSFKEEMSEAPFLLVGALWAYFEFIVIIAILFGGLSTIFKDMLTALLFFVGGTLLFIVVSLVGIFLRAYFLESGYSTEREMNLASITSPHADPRNSLSFNPSTNMVEVIVPQRERRRLWSSKGNRQRSVSFIDSEAVKAHSEGKVQEYLLRNSLPYYHYALYHAKSGEAVDIDAVRGSDH